VRIKPLYIANAQNFKSCHNTQDVDTLTYYVETAKVTSKEFGDYYAKCIAKGASISYNYEAHMDSRKKVTALVTRVFGL
jgi:hypothetical protein